MGRNGADVRVDGGVPSVPLVEVDRTSREVRPPALIRRTPSTKRAGGPNGIRFALNGEIVRCHRNSRALRPYDASNTVTPYYFPELRYPRAWPASPALSCPT